AHLPQARARYQSALLPVCLQVSPEILRQRLENRGRENASEINARLARAARYTPQDCHTLNNDGSLRQSVDTQPLAMTERTLRIVLMNLHPLAAIPAP
ncbi:Ribose 1,5-bisphosphate phosphokinase PhnN, partial [human gut metagenome]